MAAVTVHFAPGVPDLGSIGVEAPEELLSGWAVPDAGARRRSTAERSELVSEQPGRTILRRPLPGTPDENGRVHERPCGAGTGWLWIVRYDAGSPWRELARARLRAPRSQSLAGRDWNFACQLRAHGVATPELVALVEDGSGPVARRSALVVRELEDWTRLDRWLAREHDGPTWRSVAGALGRFFYGLRRASVDLPELELADLWVSPDEACSRAPVVDGTLQVRRRASLALGNLRGARFAPVTEFRVRRGLERLDAQAGAVADVPERARLFAACRALQTPRALIARAGIRR